MKSQHERALGVTPGLSQDCAERSADQQATFLLSYLRQGMVLLDVGCGLGTIALGLAQAPASWATSAISSPGANLESRLPQECL